MKMPDLNLLSYEIDVSLILEVFVELDDVRVIKSLKDFDLSLESLPVSDLRASNFLDSSSLSRLDMSASTHITVSTFSKLLGVDSVHLSDRYGVLNDHGLLPNNEVVICLNHF